MTHTRHIPAKFVVKWQDKNNFYIFSLYGSMLKTIPCARLPSNGSVVLDKHHLKIFFSIDVYITFSLCR